MRKSRSFLNQSLRTKLIFPVMLTMALSLGINLILFGRIDTTVKNMDQVYATNIRLGELEGLLTELESDVYQYLNIQSQDAFVSFGQKREVFEAMIEEIDDTITDHPARRMERNIRSLAQSWLKLTDEAVLAKQDHDVASYRASYVEIQKLYGYLLSYMRGLDDLRFKANSENYNVLYQYLRYLEIFIIAVLVGVTCCLMVLLYVIIGNFTGPLEKLARKAKEVGRGNFGIALEEPRSEDEVGIVTGAFNQMIVSINDYIRKTRESMELEIKMKERELAMESLLKDAQLKYYQAQINPHFLFNTLNAGQQLAMMEDAERTYEFIENMASFFRYRLKSNGEASTLQEEIGLIDSYMYIMNVRYSNEIHLEKSIDNRLLDILFPGMVLQPVIENALNHGLSGVEWEKKIRFTIRQENKDAVICIRDNGMGISEQVLEELRTGQPHAPIDQKDTRNGVGLVNVRERLRLYFDRMDVMTVESDGEGAGTAVTIRVPIRRKA
ncbi:MAG: histidine kinase [Lachnospiraceae bacterium]|nr:histidine kinase [Lachnospiraceae bacterium]